MAGTISKEQTEFLETWENLSPATHYVIKLDIRGDEKHEPVSGKNRRFTLTTQERMITQSKIIEPKKDPFLNGAFRPVITPDDINIETNPNALSDEDILKIFEASAIAFDEWLETVDAESTLRRMLVLAEDDDDIAYKRVRKIEQRVLEVTGGPKHATQKDEETYKALGGQGGDKEARKNASKRAMTSSQSA